ncbi:hypothetical protein JOC73_001023 [Alkaliphilus hydrothermalis]|uniref:DUF116 domain-containing protein n=1 Tax=Alkaliphilus hydrothermalis TaxID=1482730 RepID=A0ABS2NNS8_9FIRM|nr:hypothetical protein [Alkaliphilus hydrothermalis]
MIGLLMLVSLKDHVSIFRSFVFALLLLLWVLGALLLTTILSILWLWNNEAIPKPLGNIVGFSIPFFYPMMVILGKGLKIDKTTIRRAYTLINNKLVMATKYRFKGKDILILTPHCLQKSHCPHKITHDVDNCKKCGLCSVDKLLDLRDQYGVHFRVVTGGTLARKLILESRPKAIVAIACERDLVGGLMDIKKLPILAIINKRPEGPCVNTHVDLDEVEKAIKHFIKE